jgi:hypothetical protein
MNVVRGLFLDPLALIALRRRSLGRLLVLHPDSRSERDRGARVLRRIATVGTGKQFAQDYQHRNQERGYPRDPHAH